MRLSASVFRVLLAYSAFGGLAEGLPQGDARKSLRESRKLIYGGVQTEGQEFPFFVQPQGLAVCGGSLVADDMVLTSAWCEAAFNMSTQVLVGAYEAYNTSNGTAQLRNITGKFIKHPDFSYPAYDFALVKIQPVTLPHLKPIGLNTAAKIPKDGADLITIGFGKTAFENFPRLIRKATVQAINSSLCDQMWGYPNGTVDGYGAMCTLSSGLDKGFCAGDGGGPVFSAKEPEVLVGVNSFANYENKQCNTSWPTGAARITSAIDWIQHTICNLTSTYQAFCCPKTVAQCSRKIVDSVGCGKRVTRVNMKTLKVCCPEAKVDYLSDVWERYQRDCAVTVNTNTTA